MLRRRRHRINGWTCVVAIRGSLRSRLISRQGFAEVHRPTVRDRSPQFRLIFHSQTNFKCGELQDSTRHVSQTTWIIAREVTPTNRNAGGGIGAALERATERRCEANDFLQRARSSTDTSVCAAYTNKDAPRPRPRHLVKTNTRRFVRRGSTGSGREACGVYRPIKMQQRRVPSAMRIKKTNKPRASYI